MSVKKKKEERFSFEEKKLKCSVNKSQKLKKNFEWH